MKCIGLMLLALVAALIPIQLAGQEGTSSRQGKCIGASEPARCELHAGVESYKNALYEDAIWHFRRAVELDSKFAKPRLYLGTTLAQQFIPGADTPDNNRYAEQAIAEFSAVLDMEATDRTERLSAMRGIGSLYFQSKKFNKAKEYYRQIVELEPDDAESYYGIGVIDWTQSYAPRMEAYVKHGIVMNEGRLDPATCQQLAEDHMSVVEEGMQMLTKAISLRPDYDDAMAYMNLLYRERADLRCNDEAAREADLTAADKWVDTTLATKKSKVEKIQKTGTEHP